MIQRATEAANQDLTNSLLESELGLSDTRNELLTQAVVNLEALVTQSVFSRGERNEILANLAAEGVVLPNLRELLGPAQQQILPIGVGSGAGSGAGNVNNIPSVTQTTTPGTTEAPIVVENNITVEMDGKEVAKIVGPNIAQQRNVRRNL